MTLKGLLDLTAWLETRVALAAGAILVVLAADALLAERHEHAQPSLDASIAPRTERRLLALLLLLTALVRVVGWQSGLTPAWWFTEVSVLPIDKMLRDGTLWTTWMQLLASMRIDFAHQATFVLPVLAGLQSLLGPRFGLPVLAAALMGTLAVLLGWALGREMRSQAFGLVLAALLAFSPVEIMWSRLSAMVMEGVAHVMLALLVAYVAGRRGSILLALLAGVVAWTSFQQYYLARVSTVLVVVGIVAGAQRAMRLPRGIALVLVAAVGFGAAHVAVHGTENVGASFWPSYGGYIGNRGEATLTEVVTQNVGVVASQMQRALSHYFVMRRTGWETHGRDPGLENGGLCSAAVALLGLVGVVAAGRRFRRQWPLFVVAAIGLAIPALSATSARRMVLFDVAWCGFAAHGLFAVVDGLGRRVGYRARVYATAGVVVLLALWSTTAVFALSAAMPAGYGRHIPFGESGFGDGIACKRCVEAAKGWQRDLADGAFVVLVDGNPFRENRTSPGGLRAYGKIASLAAVGTTDRFVELYALMANWDPEVPTAGRMFDPAETTFAEELEARTERSGARVVVWHFEEPSAWERWLVARLRAVGGTVDAFQTPLSPLGLRVTMPVERWPEAAIVIGEIATGLTPSSTACFDLSEVARVPVTVPVFGVVAGDSGSAGPPEWIITSWDVNRFRSHVVEAVFPIGSRVARTPDGNERLEFVTQYGALTHVELPSLRKANLPLGIEASTFAAMCGAWADGHWWVLEAGSGRVRSTHPAAGSLPAGAWIGIAAGQANELVLASGDQSILVFDLGRRETVASFPARVSPTVRYGTHECTPIAVGRDWIGVVNPRTFVLSVYTRSGTDLGTRRLDRLMAPSNSIATIGGAGRHIGVAGDTFVGTFELRLDPSCAEGGAAAK